jgi:hypothetical protein
LLLLFSPLLRHFIFSSPPYWLAYAAMTLSSDASMPLFDYQRYFFATTDFLRHFAMPPFMMLGAGHTRRRRMPRFR